jgi:hypothetical protein
VPAKERAPIQGKGYSSEFLRSLCQERKMWKQLKWGGEIQKERLRSRKKKQKKVWSV